MTWTATALSTANIDSTTDNLASGLNELKLAVDRVNELSAHPSAAHRTAMALTAQSVVQFASATFSTWVNIPGSTAANIIPLDDTIPQRTEGYGLLSVSFTPKSATSTIVLQVTGSALCGGTVIYDGAVAALFSDSTTNALNAAWISNAHTAGVDHIANLAMSQVHTAGSTGTRIYSFRIGPTTSTGNVAINGNSGTRVLGSASTVVLSVTELA